MGTSENSAAAETKLNYYKNLSKIGVGWALIYYGRASTKADDDDDKKSRTIRPLLDLDLVVVVALLHFTMAKPQRKNIQMRNG